MWSNHTAAAVQLPCEAQFCDCAAGNFQVFALSTTGVLYVTGRSKSCGQGRKWSSSDLVPVTTLSGISIKRIFAYCNHSVAIDEEGRVYVCGSNNYGQLGLGDVRKSNTFERVPVFDDHPAIVASLGDTFTAFITEGLELYTCGDGDEYRLCNTTIGKVRTPALADATIGKSIMWISCGCSHMIIAENLDEVPQHPGRQHFGLDGTTRRKRKKLPYQNITGVVSSLSKAINIDISDFGSVWTGYSHGDIVEYKNYGKCTVIGTTSRGLVIQKDNENILIGLKDMKQLFDDLKIISRPGCQFKTLQTRAGFNLPIDISPSSSEVFGFCVGDRVNHSILGPATVEGVFGGCLWFAFDDEDGKITTTLLPDISYLHKWLSITKGANGREVEYCILDSTKLPIEKSPCNVLDYFDLEVGDIVETADGVGEVYGCFSYFAVVKDSFTNKLCKYTPSSLLLLRRILKPNSKNKSIFVDRLSLDGLSASVNVTCNSDSQFKPFDRVITKRGHGTIIGIGENNDNKWWVQTDDALSLGGGIGYMSDSSSFKLVRRICGEGFNEEGISVSTDDFQELPVFPDDVIILNDKKYRVIGMTKSQTIKCKIINDVNSNGNDGFREFQKSELNDVSIVFRADLKASRIYHSKTGNGLNLSVSMRDFIGKRFIPDDVIETPFGLGLVVGIADSNLGIHLNSEHGVSFFTPQAIYDASLFKLVKRRAIVSMMNM